MKQLIIATCLLLSLPSTAQEAERKEFPQNSVFFTAGIPSFSFTYERLLKQKDNRLVYLRVLPGAFNDVITGDWTAYLSAMPTWVFGKGKKHLELGAGLTLIDPKYPQLWGAVCVAYRYHNPETNFLFRVGGSVPEGAFISLGKAF